MNPLITIIVPVYNVENYFNRCVDSLIKQTYKNIEIILVDDESPDNSGKICDEYKEKDDRITVIHKKNEGVAKARNSGLDIMKGEYVCFIDSDDYIDEDYIECLYNAVKDNDADISTCGHYRDYGNGRINRVYDIAKNENDVIIMTGKESLCDVFYGANCSASSCCKLYKSMLFDNIRFEKYIMGEDSFTLFRLLVKAKKVVHTNYSKYYYVQRAESAMHRANDNIRFYDYVRIYDDFYKYIVGCDTVLYKAFANRLTENNFYAYVKLRDYDGECEKEKKHIADNIKKYRISVIFNRKAEMRTRLACIVSLFGMKALDFVYDISEKLNKNKIFQ